MAYKIRKGVTEDAKGIAATITEAFFEQFKALCKDPDTIVAALTPAIIPERFTVAEDEGTGEVVGTVGIADDKGYPILVQPEVLRKIFGFVRGSIAASVMRDEFYRPKTFQEGQGHVDFVAVRKAARRQGLATAMVRECISSDKYSFYTLDVVEGNEKVLPIYRKVGFIDAGKEKEKGAWMKGFKFRYLMEYRNR